MKTLGLLHCLMAGFGCSDGEDLPPICDGSSQLRFGAVVSAGGSAGAGATLLWDNGVAYLFVGGTCEYHVFWGDNAWAEVRAGVLASDEELELRRTVRYGAWDGLEGSWPQGPTGVSDGSSLGFFDETRTIGCGPHCDAYHGVPRIAERLWQDGAPARGPMRVMLIHFTETPLYRVPLATWSLSIPMSALARDDTEPGLEARGEGFLLEGESDLATIRRLRGDYRDGVHGDFYYRYLPFRDDAEGGAPEYALWARDTSPFEDERGLVRAPGP